MTGWRWTLLVLLVLVTGLTACVEGEVDENNLQSGECDAGEIWCVDSSTIQYCPEGQWTDPEECPPENSGSPEIPVVIPTTCGEYGCQPG